MLACMFRRRLRQGGGGGGGGGGGCGSKVLSDVRYHEALGRGANEGGCPW